MKKLFITFLVLSASVVSTAQKTAGFQIKERKDQQQVEVLWNGKLLTAYCYYDSIKKPFLFPIRTVNGITITRGYPIQPVPGERTDHPHHTGLWMNYESVNGLDFWNNSTAIPAEKRHLYGTIKHEKILDRKISKDQALLTAAANWYSPEGKVLLQEKTAYVFRVKNNHFLIDRTTTLTATDQPVVFKDIKDGFLAIRVARELEMPSQQADVFVDSHGNKTTVAQVNNQGVTGRYYSSQGLTGDSVWSSQGRWTMLKGQKDGKPITIAIFDHPSNTGYPAYWHARGYGLFAINPLGRKIFSNGKEELNFSLQPNQSVTFRYRVLIASDEMKDAEMNHLADAFAKEK